MLQRVSERIGRKRKKLATVARCAALGQIRSAEAQEQAATEVDQALAIFGLVAQSVPQSIDALYLWPENVRSWNLFQATDTQWTMGPNSAIGLNYSGVEVVMRKYRVKRCDELQVFRDIQVMERATLAAWGEKKDG